MSNSRAAIRYAKAILDLAVDNKATDAIEKDMRSIIATVSDSAELREMLASPVIKGSDKKQVLLEVFKGSHAISEGLISMLIDNKRVSLLNEVAEKYIILNEQLKGEGVAFVTTAVALTADMEKKILKKVESMTGNKVVLENKIDESIVGGFILRVGDLQYDASIANKLSNLKREFATSL
ncbi:ATP synthase F1 subunit delta [Aurantibacter crassamenti]|uniref:ATP synthase F1 subunit delta n=1 Tax=Aurantibacter crassamenti TaxID=1837375 RepID=UPI00193998C4|nr:ATP synthase F1 subunit delta [Aurantibacter crassamenti]MBM1105290.1 ATP synthase F1 subunit delta [Aurantibacter crassamenti]